MQISRVAQDLLLNYNVDYCHGTLKCLHLWMRRTRWVASTFNDPHADVTPNTTRWATTRWPADWPIQVNMLCCQFKLICRITKKFDQLLSMTTTQSKRIRSSRIPHTCTAIVACDARRCHVSTNVTQWHVRQKALHLQREQSLPMDIYNPEELQVNKPQRAKRGSCDWSSGQPHPLRRHWGALHRMDLSSVAKFIT